MRSLASGNNQPNLNARKINNYGVVIPPLDVQNEIVAHISELRKQIKSLRAFAATTRAEAIQQFEHTIFE